MFERMVSAIGLVAMLGIAWALSSHRKRFPKRIALWGVGLQLAFGLLVLKTTPGEQFFSALNAGVIRLLDFTNKGTEFVFGGLYRAVSQDPERYAEGSAHAEMFGSPGMAFSMVVHVLPTIIFFSSFMTVLYHLGIMQKIVSGLAWVMSKTMRTSGSETLSAAANVFVGQTEAPLVVQPFVGKMTLSELNAIMVGGFATVAGGVMAAYVGMLKDGFPNIAGHLIAASVMSAPAALVVAKVMLPETEESDTAAGAKLSVEKIDANLIDAAARGAGEGLKLALNVGAMLLAFVALVAVANALVALPFELYNDWSGASVTPITLETIFGWVFWPLAFLMGVPVEECATVGRLLGEKMVLNEFVAYFSLMREMDGLSERSITLATYALCGFANFSSIAIQLGGIGGIAPERRSELAKLGLRAMFGGMLAACMTACVVGIML